MTNYDCKNPECGFGWTSEDRSKTCPSCGWDPEHILPKKGKIDDAVKKVKKKWDGVVRNREDLIKKIKDDKLRLG